MEHTEPNTSFLGLHIVVSVESFWVSGMHGASQQVQRFLGHATVTLIKARRGGDGGQGRRKGL
jgi:hypothetical protein